METTPRDYEEGGFKPLREREALELMAPDHSDGAHRHHAAAAVGADGRIPATVSPEHRVSWIRVSDLISEGTGRIAGRGIDFEAELARRLRHPIDTTQRALKNRRSALPPLDAFGRSRSNTSRDVLGRS